MLSEKFPGNRKDMGDQNSIVQDASRFIFDLFREKLSPDYVYHNFQHTFETVEAAEKLATFYPELSDEEKEILSLAAWFHDAGYIETYEGHEDKSKEIALAFLSEKNYGKDKIQKVLSCIDKTKRITPPETLIEQILLDADLVNVGQTSFFEKEELLRTEWENFGIRTCNSLEWTHVQLNFLTSISFYTQAAQTLFGEQLQSNIQEQHRKLQKLEKKKEKKRKEDGRIKAEPKRGIETMFRSIYRSHINLSSIADSKANMMISINSLIISITLTLVGAKLSLLGTSFKENQIVIYPIISLLLTSLGAIIFAILSAKPMVTSKVTRPEELKEKKLSILFFGNYSNFSVDEFEYHMKELMKNEDDLYGNMIRDLYYLGKVLTRKYILIRISYIIFMVGLISTVLVAVYVVIHLKSTDGV